MTQEQKRAAIRQAVNQIAGKKKEAALPKDGIHDNIETADDSFTIGVGVGAKAKNYDVMDLESGEIYHFVEGSKVQDVKVFAGEASKWQHVKGIGVLDVDGEELMAEIHWFQEESVGKVKFKIKEWLYD